VSKHRQAGFTLIEVMTALLIVALALPSLLVLINGQLQGAGYTRDKTQAYWIAEDQLTRLQLRQTLVENASLSQTETGTVQSNGAEWFWSITTEDTEVPGFKRLDIEVYLGQHRNNPLASLTGFMDD